jgi:hypothetical protein
VEVAGFRSNSAPRLIDVADFFIDLGDIAELIRKDVTQPGEYDVPSFVPPEEMVPRVARVSADHSRSIHRSTPPAEPSRNTEDVERPAGFIRVRDDR